MYRKIFIDSENNSFGSGEQSKIIFPSIPFSTQTSNQIMKISLSTFEMRKSFYNINQTNNKFYLFNPSSSTYTEIVIEPGNYEKYTDLAIGIKNALVAVLAGSTCTYIANKRKFEIGLGGAAGSYLVCFQVSQNVGAIPVGVTTQGSFNDSWEILGAVVNKDFPAVPKPAFVENPAGTFTSTYLAQLNSLEAIYLRTSIPSNNYETFGFQQGTASQRSGMTNTSILARIPLKYSKHIEGDSFITFEDPNELFSMLIEQSQLSQIILTLTDGKGRDIPQVAAGQWKNGSLNFKCSLKWSLVTKPNALSHNVLRLDDIPNKYSQINPKL